MDVDGEERVAAPQYRPLGPNQLAVPNMLESTGDPGTRVVTDAPRELATRQDAQHQSVSPMLLTAGQSLFVSSASQYALNPYHSRAAGRDVASQKKKAPERRVRA